MKRVLAICSLTIFSVCVSAATYSIADFGADTTRICTKSINEAISRAYGDGGGTVVVPAGRYKSGTIVLKDNVNLQLDPGAVIEASDDYADFPIMPHSEYRSLKDAGGWSALIYAEKASHISITGQGTIDGKGRGRKGRVKGVAGDCNGRPRNILFISCDNVLVEGVTIINSAIWNQHYLDCEDVTVRNIKAFNHANGNNDGIDIDGCRGFILSDSFIDSDDDGIVLKSTGTAPCEDVIVTNCIVSSYANAIKCGTESTGGFRNILISDCVVRPSKSKEPRIIKSTSTGITAISLEVVDGGIMDGVSVNNILIEGTECPLYVRLGNRGRKHIADAPAPGVGQMRNIDIRNITAYGTGNFCSSITGIPSRKIENISLSNIYFVNKGGLQEGSFLSKEMVEGARHDTGNNLHPDKYWASYKDVVEDDKGYPQPTVWRNLPCYGLFVRNVENCRLNNVGFSTEGGEPREPIIVVNVDNISLNNVTAASKSVSSIITENVINLVNSN